MSAGGRAAVDKDRVPRAGAARPSWLLGVIGLAWFLVLLDDTAVAVALPTASRTRSPEPARPRRAAATARGSRSTASTVAAPNRSRISRVPYPLPQPISNTRPPGTRPPSRASSGAS